MSSSSDNKQSSVVHLNDLEKKLEKLLNWAKTHTEIGLDLVSSHPVDDDARIKTCFVRSLEVGKELIGNMGTNDVLHVSLSHGNAQSDFPAAQVSLSSSPSASNNQSLSIRAGRRDAPLPLSGSARFGESGHAKHSPDELNITQIFATSRVGSAQHASRNSPLSPSKSYSKKKSF